MNNITPNVITSMALCVDTKYGVIAILSLLCQREISYALLFKCRFRKLWRGWDNYDVMITIISYRRVWVVSQNLYCHICVCIFIYTHIYLSFRCHRQDYKINQGKYSRQSLMQIFGTILAVYSYNLHIYANFWLFISCSSWQSKTFRTTEHVLIRFSPSD